MTVGGLIAELSRCNPDDEVVVQKCDGMGEVRTDAVGGYNVNHEVAIVRRGQMEAVVILGYGPTRAAWESKV